MVKPMRKKVSKDIDEILEDVDVEDLPKSKQKSIKSFKENIDEHFDKMEDYIADPKSMDNKGHLKNAPNHGVQKRTYKSRVEGIAEEIETYKENIQKEVQGD